MYHWHPVWTIPLGRNQRRTMLLGVPNTPAAKKTKTDQHQPSKIE
jgi:hypothetical protein